MTKSYRIGFLVHYRVCTSVGSKSQLTNLSHLPQELHTALLGPQQLMVVENIVKQADIQASRESINTQNEKCYKVRKLKCRIQLCCIWISNTISADILIEMFVILYCWQWHALQISTGNATSLRYFFLRTWFVVCTCFFFFPPVPPRYTLQLRPSWLLGQADLAAESCCKAGLRWP